MNNFTIDSNFTRLQYQNLYMDLCMQWVVDEKEQNPTPAYSRMRREFWTAYNTLAPKNEIFSIEEINEVIDSAYGYAVLPDGTFREVKEIARIDKKLVAYTTWTPQEWVPFVGIMILTCSDVDIYGVGEIH